MGRKGREGGGGGEDKKLEEKKDTKVRRSEDVSGLRRGKGWEQKTDREVSGGRKSLRGEEGRGIDLG